MGKKTILFAVNTEFVLSVSILYYEYFKIENHDAIWFILTTGENRFKNINIKMLPGEKYIFRNDLNSFTFCPDLGYIEILKERDIDEFVYQNNYFISNLMIEEFLCSKNKELIKTYISDSIGINARPSLRLILISNVYLNFRRLFNHRFRLPVFIIPTYKYVKGVNVYFSIQQVEKIETEFISFKDLLAKVSMSNLLPRVFDYEFQDDYDIYFFTQPITSISAISQETKNHYVKLVGIISQNAAISQVKVLLKIHPGESPSDYYKFQNKYCKVFDVNNIPAELLFYSIKHKVILSCFSAVSKLDFSKRNYHYWLFPLLNYKPKFRFESKGIGIIDSLEALNNIFNEIPNREDL